MNITGPIQSNLQPIQDSVDQFLKVNQRFAGEILNVSNEQVVLSVNGVQIVAKMTSMEQLAQLMERRYAYFVVKDINENQITLQLANTNQKAALPKEAASNPISQMLLENMGMVVDSESLLIAQTAVNQGLKVTPELLNEIKQVLTGIPNAGKKEVELAIALKSMGLPLTKGSIELAQQSVKEIRTIFLDLYRQVEIAVNRPGIPETIYQNLRAVQSDLKQAVITGGDFLEALERNIKESIQGLGKSLEKDIFVRIHPENTDNQASRINGLMYSLANLRQQIRGSNLGQLTDAIDRFSTGMRWMHFVNVEPENIMAKGQWTQIDLPFSFGYQPVNQINLNQIHDLHIRVAHEQEENDANKINPDYTRLIIQVDLSKDETIKVDLSIVSKLIGAEITASNEVICFIASEEMAEFQTGLSNLGYTLKTSKIEIGQTDMDLDIQEADRSSKSISSVDMGV